MRFVEQIGAGQKGLSSTSHEAFSKFISEGDNRSLLQDAYIDSDPRLAAKRFLESSEFAEVLSILTDVRGKSILDLGAGNGIASYAFAHSQATRVIALEPDDSSLIGRGAIRAVCHQLPVLIVSAFAERLPLNEQCVDIVYGRQVLHHVEDLDAAMRECARVLRPGGVGLFCREHLVRSEEGLRQFLNEHPIHARTGSENAEYIGTYLSAARKAGFEVTRVIRKWDSIINAFPFVRSQSELERLPEALLNQALPNLVRGASRSRLLQKVMKARMRSHHYPGELFSFTVRKGRG